MIEIAVIVSDVEAMPSFDGDLVHFVGDRVISIPAKRSTQVLITKCVLRDRPFVAGTASGSMATLMETRYVASTMLWYADDPF